MEGTARKEITAGAVRALFRSTLRGSDRVPGLGPCREVATYLSYLRLQRARPPHAPSRGSTHAARAQATLLAELVTLEKAYAKFPAQVAKVPALPFLEEAIRAQAAIAADIRAARAALARLGPVFAPPQRAPPAWHSEAEGLFGIFCAAMAEANPGRRFEPSNDGPAVRFIAAALRFATGEEHTEGAIAQHLKRERRKAGTARGRALSRDIG